MPLAEEGVVVDAVGEVDEEFLALGAPEAGRVVEKAQFGGRHGQAAVL